MGATMNKNSSGEGGGGAPNIDIANILKGLNLGGGGDGGLGGLASLVSGMGGGDLINPSNTINTLTPPTFNPDIGK